MSNPIKSRYLDIPLFNQIQPDPVSSIDILHTDIASISKHFDDLTTVLSLVEFNFQIIGVSEHKVQKRVENSMSNIDLEGYHPFVFDTTETTHGGTGFFVHESLVFKKGMILNLIPQAIMNLLLFELFLPNRKNIFLGCIYRHPTSNTPVQQCINGNIASLLENISAEGKICSLMGDFNIDLLKNDTNEDVNSFYNPMTFYNTYN